MMLVISIPPSANHPSLVFATTAAYILLSMTSGALAIYLHHKGMT